MCYNDSTNPYHPPQALLLHHFLLINVLQSYKEILSSTLIIHKMLVFADPTQVISRAMMHVFSAGYFFVQRTRVSPLLQKRGCQGALNTIASDISGYC